MNELIREIEADIRQERMQRLWNSFGRVMVWASVAIIAGTAAVVLWQDHRQSRAAVETSQFIKGIDRMGMEDYKGAIEVFSALAANENSNYYGLAMLRKAQAELLLDDEKAAQETYRMLAGHKGAFADIASVLATDAPLAPKQDSPFYHTQSEWKAWRLLDEGKKEEALALFAALRDDEEAPPTQRERMTQVLGHMAPGSAPVVKKQDSDE